MKTIGAALALASILGLATAADAAENDSITQSMVRGNVNDIQKMPVSGVEVIMRSDEGVEIARTTTDASGLYELGCVDTGNYSYEIVSTSGFKGHKVVAPLGPNGLEIAWAVDQKNPALASATATGGPCVGGAVVASTTGGGAAAAGAAGASGSAGTSGIAAGTFSDPASSTSRTVGMVVGGGGFAGGLGVGLAAAAGAFDSDDAGTAAR